MSKKTEKKQYKKTGHGSEYYRIKGGEVITGKLFVEDIIEWIYKLSGADIKKYPKHGVRGCSYKGKEEHDYDDIDEHENEGVIRDYCRLFPKGKQADAQSLIMLGQLMESELTNPADGQNSNIPGGYTYLGQFIDHDITLDMTPLTIDGKANPKKIKNGRSQQFDLDSVYGQGPNDPESSALYEADGKTLKVGDTTDVQNLGVFPNDLPRNGTTAIIGDHRNDENLAVAQTHLAFIKFHNAKVAENPSASFEQVRKNVQQHYQSIVLNDFLPRVCDPAVLDDVIQNGNLYYKQDDLDCMPIEFSAAAYRMGHSMVRPSYEWNRIFSTGGQFGISTFEQIFEFSGVSGTRGNGDAPFRGAPTLPSNWIVDWNRLYDFADVGDATHPQLNFTRKIDPQLTMALATLPEFQQMDPPPPAPLLSLATRNLLRGRLLSLPTGQQVADAMGLAPLSATEIVNAAPGPQKQVVGDGFDTDTPLWYYILSEAKLRGNGNHLGPVGSRIVAETIVGLIRNTDDNVLDDNPGLAFSMPEMLKFTGELNPLG